MDMATPKLTVKQWSKPLPVRPAGPGKTRTPSVYDPFVQKSWEAAEPDPNTGVPTGTPFVVDRAGETGTDEFKEQMKELRRAAEFVGCGLDIWPDVPEGIVFCARQKRERKPQATEAA